MSISSNENEVENILKFKNKIKKNDYNLKTKFKNVKKNNFHGNEYFELIMNELEKQQKKLLETNNNDNDVNDITNISNIDAKATTTTTTNKVIEKNETIKKNNENNIVKNDRIIEDELVCNLMQNSIKKNCNNNIQMEIYFLYGLFLLNKIFTDTNNNINNNNDDLFYSFFCETTLKAKKYFYYTITNNNPHHYNTATKYIDFKNLKICDIYSNENILSIFMIGFVFELENDLKTAEIYYETAITLKPHNILHFLRLSRLIEITLYILEKKIFRKNNNNKKNGKKNNKKNIFNNVPSVYAKIFKLFECIDFEFDSNDENYKTLDSNNNNDCYNSNNDDNYDNNNNNNKGNNNEKNKNFNNLQQRYLLHKKIYDIMILKKFEYKKTYLKGFIDDETNNINNNFDLTNNNYEENKEKNEKKIEKEEMFLCATTTTTTIGMLCFIDNNWIQQMMHVYSKCEDWSWLCRNNSFKK
jgi:hypothetical protein